MNIGFDLDETLIPNAAIRKAHEDFGLEYKAPLSWGMFEYSQQLREKIFQYFNDPEVMCSVYPYETSISTLRQLKKDGHKLFLISARSGEVANRTVQYVVDYFPMFSRIIFHSDKKRWFKELKLDVWVDDFHCDAFEAANIGIKTFLVSNKNTHYNHHLNWDGKIIKIHNVGEMLRYLYL